MKRRSFIQSLLAVPAVGALAKVALPQSPSPSLPRDVQTVYKGFTLMWSGWIGHQDHPRYYGHWLGVNTKTDQLVYASYPGKEGQFVRGGSFDITRVFPQIEVTFETSEEEKERAREECLNRLIRVIDNLEPPSGELKLRTIGSGKTAPFYSWFTADAPIRKGQLIAKINSQCVRPWREGDCMALFTGVAIHDAMKGDTIKVGTDGSFPVLFK